MSYHPKFIAEKMEMALEDNSYCKKCGKKVPANELQDFCCTACNKQLDNRWVYQKY